MKKLFVAAVAVLGFAFGNAQDPIKKVGISLGLPTGDIKDFTTLNVGGEFTYLWPVADKFHVGATTGVSAYLGKDQEFETLTGFDPITLQPTFGTETIEVETAVFIPVLASAQYSFTESIGAGLDLGYSIGVAPDGIESGFTFQPKLLYSLPKIDLSLGYRVIDGDGGEYSSINLGAAYKF
jgi:hypothetical protein